MCVHHTFLGCLAQWEGKGQMLMHIVQHLGPDVATVESSWCASLRFIPLKGC
jgi:hypothetical protein